MKVLNYKVYFIFIVILNVLIKAIFISQSSFSYDEIISVKDTLLDFGHIKHEAEWDNNPPFYYYCLWVWHKIFPVNEFNSRLLSVIFMSLAIGLFYLFTRNVFSEKAAITSSFLLSLSNFLTFYSQETRAYALVVLLAVLSSIIFFNFLKSNSNLDLILLSVINFLLIYTHYIAALIVITQYLFVIFKRRDLLKRFYLIVTSIVMFLVYIRFTKKQYLNIINYNKKEDFWLKCANLSDLITALDSIYFNIFIASIFFVILVIFFFYRKNSDEKNETTANFYFICLGFGSVFFLFLIGVYKAVFLSRYLIFATPFATAFCVNFIFKSKMRTYVFIPILILSVFFKVNIFKRASMDYKTVAKCVKSIKKPKDIVIVNRRDNLALFEYYFNTKLFLKFKNIDSLCKIENVFAMNEIQELGNIELNNYNSIILVQSFHSINKSNNEMLDFLSNKHHLKFHSNFYNGVELSTFSINHLSQN